MLIKQIEDFIALLDNDVKLILKGLGHIAPALTTAATVAETLTGNAELIPLTQAAGEAASIAGKSIENSDSLVKSAGDIAQSVRDVLKISN